MKLSRIYFLKPNYLESFPEFHNNLEFFVKQGPPMNFRISVINCLLKRNNGFKLNYPFLHQENIAKIWDK